MRSGSVASSVAALCVLAAVASGVACDGVAWAAGSATAVTAAPTEAWRIVGLRPPPRPKGELVGGVVVRRVVDGDTIVVDLAGADVVVRMIGINAPESVKPEWPVECFGPEASHFAATALTGATVTLEFDASQGRTDQYGRTLAYVWRERPRGGLRLFNFDTVARGYARERQYGPKAYAWKTSFSAAQRQAQRARAGLWASCP